MTLKIGDRVRITCVPLRAQNYVRIGDVGVIKPKPLLGGVEIVTDGSITLYSVEIHGVIFWWNAASLEFISSAPPTGPDTRTLVYWVRKALEAHCADDDGSALKKPMEELQKLIDLIPPQG